MTPQTVMILNVAGAGILVWIANNIAAKIKVTNDHKAAIALIALPTLEQEYARLGYDRAGGPWQTSGSARF